METFGILDAAMAVDAALHLCPSIPIKRRVPVASEKSFYEAGHSIRRRERRFIGGEHAYLGNLAVLGAQDIYHRSGSDPAVAFFDGVFAPYTATSVRVGTTQQQLDRTFLPIIQDLFRDFFRRPGHPGLSLVGFPEGRLPYHYLVALAGDIYGSPLDLEWTITRPVVRGGGTGQVLALMKIFDDEIRRKFDSDYNIRIAWNADVAYGPDRAEYIKLAKANYPHFAGDNLLAYLSYHLMAVWEATNGAQAANANDSARSRSQFLKAIVTEAFAEHFLTDMFSAGHARVPRYAFMFDIYDDDERAADLLSKLLHDHEGRLGVLLKNSSQHIWYGRGDGGLLAASNIYKQNAIGDLSPVLGNTELGGLIGSAGQLHPKQLAATLVMVSLVDVLRHFARNVPPEASAAGQQPENKGMLGYVLDRVPFAVPRSDVVDWQAVIDRTFEINYDMTLMMERLRNCEELFNTFDELSVFVQHPLWSTSPLGVLDRSDFERQICADYLNPDDAPVWIEAQLRHLTPNFSIVASSWSFPDVPSLASRIASPTPNAPRYDTAGVVMPANWKMAVPSVLVVALTSASGVWGIVE